MGWKNLFKQGKKIKTLTPKLIRVEYEGKKQPALLFVPYGTHMNFPDNGLVGLLADQGNEESLLALPTDIENREDLDAGEFAVGVPSLLARIFFRKDDTIKFKIGDIEGGDFAVRYTQLETAMTNFKASIDTENTAETVLTTTAVASNATQVNVNLTLIAAVLNTLAPGSYTPIPVVPLPVVAAPVTVDISTSKIEEIELPEL